MTNKKASTGRIRVDEKTTFTQYLLTENYMEVTLTGDQLPERLWCRLGDHDVILERRRAISTPGGAMYSKILAHPVKDQKLDLATNPNAKAPTVDLRRGDKRGRHPANLPKLLERTDQPTPPSGTPQIMGATLTGWILNATAPNDHLRMSLYEIQPDSGERVSLGNGIANKTNPDGEAHHGPHKSGFAVPLPKQVMDFQSHDLVLTVQINGQEQDLWSGSFCSDDKTWGEIMAGSRNSVELQAALASAAKHGLYALLEDYFVNPLEYSSFVIKPTDALQAIGQALMHAIQNDDDLQQDSLVALTNRFQALSTGLLRDNAQISVLVQIAEAAIKGPENDAKLQRYPHSPLAEAVMDLAMALGPMEMPKDAVLKLGALCNTSGRFNLALSLLRPLMAKEKKNPGLYVMAAVSETGLGNLDAAEELLISALKQRPLFNDALTQMARIYAKRGEPLKAATTLGGGKGLTRWLSSPPDYIRAKLLAPLDWPGVNRQVAERSNRADYLAHQDYANAIFDPAPDPKIDGFSLILTDRQERDWAGLFDTLSPLGCMQVVNQHGTPMHLIECTGQWALIIRHVKREYLTTEIISAIFAQMRTYEPIGRLYAAEKDDIGLPRNIETAGLLVRQDLLRFYGDCSMTEFVDRAEKDISVKPILL